jgi:hypothetical protein
MTDGRACVVEGGTTACIARLQPMASYGRCTAVMPLVGRRGSVRSARGRAVRGDEVLGADIGAGAIGPAVTAVPRRVGPARGAVWRLLARDVA